jgi:hypothetical protein
MDAGAVRADGTLTLPLRDGRPGEAEVRLVEGDVLATDTYQAR